MTRSAAGMASILASYMLLEWAAPTAPSRCHGEDGICVRVPSWRWQPRFLPTSVPLSSPILSFLQLALVKMAVAVADSLTDSFPEYIDPFELFDTMTAFSQTPADKAVAGVRASEPNSRYPSPQPSHLCLPHQAARKATMGYVAPAFLEKPTQVKEGKTSRTTTHKALRDLAANRCPSDETPHRCRHDPAVRGRQSGQILL